MDKDQHDPYRPTANEVLEALKRPEPRLSNYDKQRLDEMNRANAPVFWIGYVVVLVGGGWLLLQLLDWWNSL